MQDLTLNLRGINDRGEIVGAHGGDGFLLSGGTFTVIDVPGPAGPLPTVPVGINDRGQIVGYYTDNATGRQHGFLATPVPEPASLLLLGSGLVGMAAWRKKKAGKGSN